MTNVHSVNILKPFHFIVIAQILFTEILLPSNAQVQKFLFFTHFNSAFYTDCSPQCLTCSDTSDYCLTCTNPNLSPPSCLCDPLMFNLALSTLTTCIPQVCSHQCLACEISSSNCITCSTGRDFAPDCNCAVNYLEVNSTCVSCDSHFFYNYATNSCEECSFFCKECSNKKSKCTECLSELVLLDSICLCSDFTSFFLTPDGGVKCSSEMNVTLALREENFEYYLVFTFDEILNEIDFYETLIDDLIFIYISNINQSSFHIDSSRI